MGLHVVKLYVPQDVGIQKTPHLRYSVPFRVSFVVKRENVKKKSGSGFSVPVLYSTYSIMWSSKAGLYSKQQLMYTRYIHMRIKAHETLRVAFHRSRSRGRAARGRWD